MDMNDVAFCGAAAAATGGLIFGGYGFISGYYTTSRFLKDGEYTYQRSVKSDATSSYSMDQVGDEVVYEKRVSDGVETITAKTPRALRRLMLDRTNDCIPPDNFSDPLELGVHAMECLGHYTALGAHSVLEKSPRLRHALEAVDRWLTPPKERAA